MSLLALVVTLVLIGVLCWLVTTKIPMSNTIKALINVVAIIVAVLLVLQAFGVLDELRSVKVPQIK